MVYDIRGHAIREGEGWIMKINKFIVYAVVSFVVALASWTNSQGMLLSFINSDLVSYFISIMNALFFIVGLVAFYFVGLKFSTDGKIIRPVIVIFVSAVVGYFVPYIVMFQLNSIYVTFYGEIIYPEVLFYALTSAVPLALASFAGLSIAYGRKPSLPQFEGAGIANVPDDKQKEETENLGEQETGKPEEKDDNDI
jgi:magnesium-transporting ATPase (P-type)